jgi:CheY-like chemotaxis protein
MVYGAVEQAGGAIDVDTAVGRGTTVHVYFPHVADDRPAGDESTAAPIAARGSETVLPVEDDHAVRTLVGNGLRKAGYTVLEATDSAQALDLARGRTAPIHLLLTDVVVMPGLNGREVAVGCGRSIETSASCSCPATPMTRFSGEACRRQARTSSRSRFRWTPSPRGSATRSSSRPEAGAARSAARRTLGRRRCMLIASCPRRVWD